MNTILIIEQENSIRKALCLGLQNKGYTVFEAQSFAEGCSLLETADIDSMIVNYDNLEKDKFPYLLSYSVPVFFLTDALGLPLRLSKNLPEFVYQFKLPFHMNTFLAQIDSLIHKKSKKYMPAVSM